MIVSQGRDGLLVALSPREAEVLRLIVANLKTPEISRNLRISERTVETHIFRLCQGLHVRGRRELILWAIQNPRAIDEPRPPARAGLHPRGCTCGALPCAFLPSAA